MSSSNDQSTTPPVASGGPGPSFEPVGGSYYGSSGRAPHSPAATPARASEPAPAAPSPVPPPGAAPYGSPSAGSAPYPQSANLYGQTAQAQPPSPYGAPYGQGAGPYGQPASPYGAYGAGAGDIYGVYGYQAPTKSKAAAALLAFFLGGLGVHNFYLGQMGRGFGHLALGVGGWAGLISAGIAASSNPASEDFFFTLLLVFYMLPVANGIWAFVEFIIILIKPEHELGR